MATTPIIQSTGSISGAGTAGQGRNNLVLNETVSLSDTEPLNSGASYVWSFVDLPIGSATVMINSTTATPSFVPDVDGSYWVQCIVDGTFTSTEVLAVPLEATGARIPAWDENSEYDEGGNTKGWHESQTVWMRAVDTRLVGVHNAKTFNAVGDGVTDDYTALQAAVDYAVANDLWLDLSDRQYRFNTPITITGDLKMRNGTLRWGGASTNTCFTITGTPKLDRVHFYKIQNTALTGLSIIGAVNGSITHCKFDNWRNGSCIALELLGCQIMNINNCEFDSNDQDVNMGLNGMVICTDCVFYSCRSTGSINTSNAPAFYINQAAGLTFYGCGFEDSANAELVELVSTARVRFHDCRFEGVSTLTGGVYSYVRLDQTNLTSFDKCSFANTTPNMGTYPDIIADDGATPSTSIRFTDSFFPAASASINGVADFVERECPYFNTSGANVRPYTAYPGNWSLADAQAAVDSGRDIIFDSGTFDLGTTGLSISGVGVTIRGNGKSTLLTYSGTGKAIDVSATGGANHVNLLDFKLQGTSDQGQGIYVGSAMSSAQVRCERVEVADFATGLYLFNSQISQFRNMWIHSCGDGVQVGPGDDGFQTATLLDHLRVESNTGVGIRVKSATGLEIVGCIIETNGEEGLLFDTDRSVSAGFSIADIWVLRNYFENNNFGRGAGSYGEVASKVTNTYGTGALNIIVRNNTWGPLQNSLYHWKALDGDAYYWYKNRGGSKIFGNPTFKTDLTDPVGSILYDVEFHTPVTQTFTNTQAGRATDLGIMTGPDHIWPLNEASGSAVDAVGSLNLNEINGSNLIRQRELIGFYDGSDFSSKLGIEFKEASAQMECPNTTDLTHNSTTSYAAGCAYRGRGKTSTDRSIFGKRNAGSAYWWVVITSTGAAKVQCHDGTTLYSATISKNHDDGALHYIYVVIDRTADVLYIYSDLGSDSVSISGASAFDDTGAKFSFGRTVNNSPYCQLTDGCYWVGAAAEAVDGTALSTWWSHGSDPSGLLTTVTRASTIALEVEPGKIAHFSGEPTIPQLAIGYHPQLPGTQLGLYCNDAVQNLHTDSESPVGWTSTSSASVADNQADGPDGFESAGTITATAANGYAYEDSTCVDSTTYTYSLWVKRNGVSDVVGSLQLYDVANTTTMATKAFTATSSWQLVTVTGVTGISTTSVRSICQVNTNTESVYVFGAQVNVGTGRGAYIRTVGSNRTLTESDYRVGTLNTGLLNLGRYEVATVASLNDGGGRFTDLQLPGGTNNDRKSLAWDGTDAIVYVNFGTIGVLNNTLGSISLDTFYTGYCRWDADAGDFAESTATTAYGLMGGANNTITTTGTPGMSALDMWIGRGQTAGSSLNGFVQSVVVYDSPGQLPE